MSRVDGIRAPDGAGPLCLQGGAEFGRSCQPMDQTVVARSRMGPVVILPAAAAPGDAYVTAGRSGVRYYRRWVGDDVVVAPDPRTDPGACAEVVGNAALIVLPGGSPTRLLEALRGPLGDAVRARWHAGAGVSGASAGAMVLCERLVRADGDGELDEGLGLVPGIALPHYHGEDRWGQRLPSDLPRWGLPECGGVLVTREGVRAVGAGEAVLIEAGVAQALPR